MNEIHTELDPRASEVPASEVMESVDAPGLDPPCLDGAAPELTLPRGASGGESDQNEPKLEVAEEDQDFGVLDVTTEDEVNYSDDKDLFEAADDSEESTDPLARARHEVQVALDELTPDAAADGAGTDNPNNNVPPTGGNGSGGRKDGEGDDAEPDPGEIDGAAETVGERDPKTKVEGTADDDPDADQSVEEESQAPERHLTAEERRARTDMGRALLQRGTFVRAAEVSNQIGHQANFRSSPALSAARGILLARRIEDEDGPNTQAHFSYSTQYLVAVSEYKDAEEIDSAEDALQEVATEEWGEHLAWGIRAEYQDAVRAHGEFMSIDEAVETTGIARATLFQRGLAKQVEGPHGRQVWMIPTEGLLDRELWTHQAFGQLRHSPDPVSFYGTREVADMLHQKAPATIRKLIYRNLLPGVTIDAPARGEPDREQRNFYVQIPAPDAEALRDYGEGNQRRTLRAVVRGFIEDNPNQFTITRGRFEAHVHTLQQRGGLRYKSEVERLLGTSGKFLEFYELESGDGALQALHWNRVIPPASRRVSEVDARTVRDAVGDVLERHKDPDTVASDYGVSKRTVYNWLKAASQGRI